MLTSGVEMTGSGVVLPATINQILEKAKREFCALVHRIEELVLLGIRSNWENCTAGAGPRIDDKKAKPIWLGLFGVASKQLTAAMPR